MPKKTRGEGGRPPEQSKDDTDPEKTGVSETDTGEITKDVEGVEVDETLVSVPPDAERTSVRRPQTGELPVLPDELGLPEEDESGDNEPAELPVHSLDKAEARALSQSGTGDDRDEPTDPGRERQTIKDGDDKQRRIKFGKLWDELATLAGKEIEREEFTRFQERQKAGEDVDVLLRELLQIVTQRRALAAAAEIPADEVVGQGDDILENQARKELKGEIRRARSRVQPTPAAEEETLDSGATHVMRTRRTPRRPESTEIIPPPPKPKKEKTWLDKLKFWK